MEESAGEIVHAAVHIIAHLREEMGFAGLLVFLAVFAAGALIIWGLLKLSMIIHDAADNSQKPRRLLKVTWLRHGWRSGDTLRFSCLHLYRRNSGGGDRDHNRCGGCGLCLGIRIHANRIRHRADVGEAIRSIAARRLWHGSFDLLDLVVA
jgi:hypothetical protein